MIHINRILCLFFSLCSISLFAMELKEEGANLPEINLAFFGLNRASRSQFPDCLSLFAQALVTQDKLVCISDAHIEIERQIKQIEQEWNDYSTQHLQTMLTRNVGSENEKHIEEYMQPILANETGKDVPIIGTTPRAIVAIFMHKDLIIFQRLPKGILRIISRLIASDDDEVKFLGKYFRFNFDIQRKNKRHDELTHQHEPVYNQMKLCLEKIEKIVGKCSLLWKYLYAAKRLIEIREQWRKVISLMKNPQNLTKKEIWIIEKQATAKSKNVIDPYVQHKHFFDSLHFSIITKLDALQNPESCVTCSKKKNKKVKKQNKTVHHDLMSTSLLCLNFSDEEEDLDISSGEQGKQICTIPELQIDMQEQEQTAVYRDGTIIEQESDNELTYILDSDNKIKICLYSSPRNNPVTGVLPLSYMPHINEWFIDANQALECQGYNDPTHKKYTPECKRFETIQIHRFSRHVDRFIGQKGIQTITPSRRVSAKEDICITIPGHIEDLDTGERNTCLFVYLIDSATGECYHRNIEFKPEYRLTQEFLEKGYYYVNFPPLS